MASARHNVARILLEFLWTKISLFCNVHMSFGLNMDHENTKALIFARGASRGEHIGFEIRTVSYSEQELQRDAITVRSRWVDVFSFLVILSRSVRSESPARLPR